MALLATWLGSGIGLTAPLPPTLTVTPSAVGNDYTGLITLNITGAQTGEKVIIQKYIDANGDGLIEPGEPLMAISPYTMRKWSGP